MGVMEDYSVLSDISVGFLKFLFFLSCFSTYVLPKGKDRGNFQIFFISLLNLLNERKILKFKDF